MCLRSGDNHIIATQVDFELFQRTRWRPANVLSTQVVLPVVTGAPNLFSLGTILNDALKVCADRRERFEFTSVGMNENARLVAKLENLAGVDRNLAEFRSYHRVFCGFNNPGRLHEPENWIQDCTHRRERTGPQQIIKESSSARFRCVYRIS